MKNVNGNLSSYILLLWSFITIILAPSTELAEIQRKVSVETPLNSNNRYQFWKEYDAAPPTFKQTTPSTTSPQLVTDPEESSTPTLRDTGATEVTTAVDTDITTEAVITTQDSFTTVESTTDKLETEITEITNEPTTTDKATDTPAPTTELAVETTPEEVLTTVTETSETSTEAATEPSLETTPQPWQNVTEIDIQRDIPNNGRWNFDCSLGYADVPSSFNCEAGGINIPPDSLNGEVGFWAKCRVRCSIAYTVHENDRVFKARIYQKGILSEIIYNRGRTEFVAGQEWVNFAASLVGVEVIELRLDHLHPDMFVLLDKLSVEGE